jgi:hypothetical protein
MSDINEENPKRELVQDAIKELNLAKRHLKSERGVGAQLANNNIKMALHILKGILNTYDIPQEYHLD